MMSGSQKCRWSMCTARAGNAGVVLVIVVAWRSVLLAALGQRTAGPGHGGASDDRQTPDEGSS